MSLEKIVNGMKKGIATIAVAATLAGLGGCGKSINPLGAKFQAATSRSADYNFSGDTIQASITPTEEPYQKVEVAVKKPGDADFGAYEQITNPASGTYTKSLATLTYGNYDIKFRIISDRNETTSEQTVTVPVYMNEAQSDAAIQEVLQSMVKPGSTTNYDIINCLINQDAGVGVNVYNNDAWFEIYDSNAGGNQKAYIIDIQGLRTDTFNQQKKNDATSVSAGYKNPGPMSSKNEIQSFLNDLKQKGYPIP